MGIVVMKLRRLILKNFRGYRSFDIPFGDNLNVIIGKNDVGKSTILDALEIFLSSDIVKLEIQDLHVKTTELQITICLIFEVDSSKEYLLDSDVKSSLQEEFLLNSEGFLEVRKVWDCSRQSLTAKSLKTFIVADYPKEYKQQPLITLKIAELRKIAKEKGLEQEVEDKRVSSEFRKVLYQCARSQDTETTPIPVDKEDAKKIWDSLKTELPFLALFQSDRQNKDTDKEFQDPLKVIAKQAISEVEDDLQRVVAQIEEKAIEKGRRTIEKLAEMSPEIAKTLFPNIKNKNWDSLFSFSFTSDEGIPLNKRGSGVRRLILLNYFRSEAEEKAEDGRNIVYAIEEPETSQHPLHQVMLINSLIELAENENRQVIITTHSPEIAKLTCREDLCLIDWNENQEPVLITSEEKKLHQIKQTIGIMPYLSKVVVCVEGENDINFIKNINKVPEYKSILDLDTENLSIIPMTGENLCSWIERNYLQDSNVVEFHLYDNDKPSYKAAVEEMNNAGGNRSGLITQMLQMENYLHWSLIEDFYQKQGFRFTEEEKANWVTLDVPKVLERRTPFNERTIKRRLNRNIPQRMTRELLHEINAFDEIKSWFEAIKERVQYS
ncbi:AAA family ATPase [candidate division KSB3 bacterium]|uniref:AAA family ATPase n=1 Tax=candidate division KSB3 bacterium TaxID=2044937 RepID=A0A9D5Q5W3_9BACT|nr:AAA family ATPase [candidate division KSB3 bacterium]MBD3325244.1 AAA family ATPase [candidate division KSB3 bacterium]